MQRLTRFTAALLSAGLALTTALPAQADDTPITIAPPAPGAGAARPTLSVCADPANLPYSDQTHPGFENKIADLLAADLHADLTYTWQGFYRAFLKRSLLANHCDVVIDVPATLPGVTVTRPFYASSYVAVTRSNDKRHFETFDDPWLRDAKIGVQNIGTEKSETPPLLSLAMRNIVSHITGFVVRTTGPELDPQGKIIDAVANGSIDIAFVWGPIAGYFAKTHGAALKLEKITQDLRHPNFTFVYPMSVGVRKDSTALRDRLQDALDRHTPEIAAILASYGIPTVPLPASVPSASPMTTVAQKVDAQASQLPPPTH